MNIAIFTDTYYPEVNGVSTSVDLQRQIFRNRGHRVFIVAPGLKGQNEITFEDDIMRIPTFSLNFAYTYHMSVRFSNKALKILKSLSLDLIHAEGEFGLSTFGSDCARKLNIPFVYTFHSAYGNYLDYVSNQFRLIRPFSNRIVTRLVRQMCAKADETIVPTRYGLNKMREIYIDKYVNVIPNPVSPSIYEKENDPRKQKEFIAQHHLEGKKVLLYVGTLSPEKNVAELITYFEKYLDLYGKDKAALVIVGDGTSRKELGSEVRDDLKGSVIFVGGVFHEETPFYYGLADVFVSASTGETQGLAFTEAAAAGVPLLLKFGFHLADFIEDGRTGFFYRDFDGFAKGLQTVFSMTGEEKEGMVSLSREKLLAGNSDETFYENLTHVYKKAQRKYF